MDDRPSRADESAATLSDDFDRRLKANLLAADGRQRRFSAVKRWRWTAFAVLPVISAVCWAALPWSFGIGARALIGSIGYVTLMLAVASRINSAYLGYLGISFLPVIIDVALLVGVVSWLILTSRVQYESPAGEPSAAGRTRI
jgi:hypothetical protein